ncbi:MAG: sugar transferase [Candidatus Azambacteria bacterium]|nr:sugar transferase [Candidatus Azambacteria bacterium]
MKKAALLFTVALVPVDFIMLFFAGISAYFLRTSTLISQYRPVLFYLNLPFEKYIIILLSFIPFCIAMFALTGLYRARRGDILQEFFQVVAASSFAMMAVVIYIFITREWFDSRFIVIAAWALTIGYVFLGRVMLRVTEWYLAVRHQLGVKRVLIIGDDEVSDILIREIKRNPSLRYRVVKQIAKLDLEEVRGAIINPCIDAVIVGRADYSKEAVVELAEFCRDHHLTFRFAPTLFQALTTNVEVDVVGGIPLIEVKHTALDGWGKVIKRAMDLVGSLVGIIILSPFFVVTAVLIRLDSKGPVFVALDRITLGKKFAMYKFRSMVDRAHEMKEQLTEFNERNDGGPLFKMHNDPRVTRIGRVLRKMRIDELPQLFNVLKGEMSLVGPRPHEPKEVGQYERHHKKLLVVKAGMTGMAQISGSSNLPFEEEVKLDTYYIENWSLFLDIKILLRTVMLVIRDRSAC